MGSRKPNDRGRVRIELTRELLDRMIKIPVGDEGCPVVVRPALAEEAAATRVVGNAVIMLDALAEGPQKLTEKTKQLNRRFVRSMFEALELGERFKDLRRGRSTLDEDEVWPLAMLRDLLQISRLARVLHGKLLITRRGDQLRASGREGELHNTLLMTYLRRYNIAATDRYPEDPVMAELLGPALFRFGTLLRKPVPLSEFAERLPHDADIWDAPLSLLEFGIDPAWQLHDVLTRRLLEPLAGFGLLTSSEGSSDGNARTARLREDSVRRWSVTPLFDRLVGLDTGQGVVSFKDVHVPLPEGAQRLVPESQRMSVRESLDAYAHSAAQGDPEIAAHVRQRLMLIEVLSGVPFMTASIGSKTPIEATIERLPRMMKAGGRLGKTKGDPADELRILAVIFSGYVTWCVTHGQARHEIGAKVLAALRQWLPPELDPGWNLN